MTDKPEKVMTQALPVSIVNRKKNLRLMKKGQVTLAAKGFRAKRGDDPTCRHFCRPVKFNTLEHSAIVPAAIEEHNRKVH
jgi:hypothetical protein